MKWKKVNSELSEHLEMFLKEYVCQKRLMFGCPVYFINNNMFTGVQQDNIILRLSKKEQEEIRSEFDEIEQFEPMKGRVMKEYIVLPEVLYSDDDVFVKWLKRSYNYASLLPPNERKKKKSKKR